MTGGSLGSCHQRPFREAARACSGRVRQVACQVPELWGEIHLHVGPLLRALGEGTRGNCATSLLCFWRLITALLMAPSLGQAATSSMPSSRCGSECLLGAGCVSAMRCAPLPERRNMPHAVKKALGDGCSGQAPGTDLLGIWPHRYHSVG